ncbi:HpcH/HpaI aldolase family protein [Halobaculum gomorrense]|uniref:2-dehydro-3-deoxyglucarate aldolase/4-hydroxy-2-oxoheptanedioate aldolase n=1 Tax=Halobaculum gomorrense TaxID=43928 RepID=A0A1M5MUZ3_9EURY|nr:aldolase/citrate lyase family protein [Halobaculum gomorrense]SHG81035.1 2-dehydro-3-deoxyglucarate aldolase/4-hydroxy-2-oxoheptanedioate aldolase [Halobaculum gomorrense]
MSDDPGVAGLRATLRESPAGHWLSTPSPQLAEQLALTDADFVVIDTEHAPTGLESVEAAVRAVDAANARDGAGSGDRGRGDTERAAAADTAAVVRVAWNDHVRIKRVLDTGAAGVMAPQVNTAAQAESFVDAVRYPPEGRRGVAGTRASAYGRDLDGYYERANDRVAAIAQIETEAAVENAGEIAAVDGLDALLVGPADLSADLGIFGEYEAERFRAAVESVLADSEVPVGTLATSLREVDEWADLGYDYQIVGVDAGYVAGGAEAALTRYDESREN